TELAPRPDAIRVAPDLVPALSALSAMLGGALAVVTGRRKSEIDAFLSPLRPPLAAEHGALLRFPDGSEQSTPPPDLRQVAQLAMSLAQTHPGLLVEQKSAA